MKGKLLLVIQLGLSILTCSNCLTDPGFNLFFKSNLDEMTHVPIEFENPLPSWIQGTLVRNGLGRFELGERKFLHVFDAFGKLSSWTFYGNGSADFSTKMMQSDFYKASCKKGDIAPYLLFEGVTPDFNEVEKLEALSRGIDNMNVNVLGVHRNGNGMTDYIAVNDFWKIYTFSPHDLNTLGSVTAKVPRGKQGTGGFAFLNMLSSAHPLPESNSPTHLTFLSSVSLVPWIKSTISLVRIRSVENRELVAKWQVDKVPYMHSFSVTDHYAVIFASPFYVNTMKMIKYAKPFESLDWTPEDRTKVYVIHLATGKVDTLETDTMFTMHHVNAFETEDGKLVVDVSSYPSPDFVADLQVEVVMDEERRNSFDPHALLKRYIIDIEARGITLNHFEPAVTSPASVNLDMPVINENHRHKQYCFVYGIVLKQDNVSLSNIALVKKNVCGQPSLDRSWTLKNHYAVEPWFVPTPNGTEEDDGLLMVPIIDGVREMSYLGILDAKTMELVNKAYLPTIVPYNLHGRFFPGVY